MVAKHTMPAAVLAVAGFVGGMFGLALRAGPVLAQGSGGAAPEVCARSFVLVDADGRERARLGADRESTGMSLYDGSGRERVDFGVTTDGRNAGMGVSHANGKRAKRAAGSTPAV